MINGLWWIWIWAISGGQPFRWTVRVTGLNYQNVTAEASLSKIVLANTGGTKSAKAAVLHAQYGPITYTGSGVQQSSNNWGVDGSPMQYLPTCSWMTFALEVEGTGTYAQMSGKLFIH